MEIYTYLTGKVFVNNLAGIPADYNYKTVYDRIFEGKRGYICGREEILEDIRAFVKR